MKNNLNIEWKLSPISNPERGYRVYETIIKFDNDCSMNEIDSFLSELENNKPGFDFHVKYIKNNSFMISSILDSSD